MIIAASRTDLRKRTDLIERRRVCNHAVAADAAVSRLDSDHAAKRRRLANRSAGVGAERTQAFMRRDCGGRSARRSAGDARGIVRIHRRPERGVLRRRAHREFIHVRLADEYRAGIAQPLDHRRVKRRHEGFQDSRRASRANAPRRVDILDAERNPAHRRRVARGQPSVSRARLLERLILAHRDEGVEPGLGRGDSIETIAGELRRGDFARAELRRCLGDCKSVQFRRHARDLFD